MKNKRVYEAIRTAIDEYGKQNGFNGREHIARAVGLNGVNGDKQLSAILNTTTFCPTNPKQMKLDMFINIAYELDDEFSVMMINALAHEFSFMVVKPTDEKTEAYGVASLLELYIGINQKNTDTSVEVMKAIKDGEIDEIERVRLSKSIDKQIIALNKMKWVLG